MQFIEKSEKASPESSVEKMKADFDSQLKKMKAIDSQLDLHKIHLQTYRDKELEEAETKIEVCNIIINL